jgi:hypothetical protein
LTGSARREGARDVPAQSLEFLALMRPTAHPGMQAEAMRIGAQGCVGFLVPAGYGSKAQQLLSGARPQLAFLAICTPRFQQGNYEKVAV